MPAEIRIPDLNLADTEDVEGALIKSVMSITGDPSLPADVNLERAGYWADRIKSVGPSNNPFVTSTLAKSNAFAAGLSESFSQIRTVLAELGKEVDFNFMSNNGTGIPSALPFAILDLTGPARAPFPTYAPFRTRVPRRTTEGPAHLEKIISGVSGSETGGLADVNPAFPLEVPTAGSNLEGARGNPIDYATADVIIKAQWNALRTAVTWPARYGSRGFQDLNSMVTTLLMSAGMIAEDKEMLLARDTVLSAPVLDSTNTAARDPLPGEVGITGSGSGGTNVYIKATAVGQFGAETGPSPAITINIANGATKVIDVYVGSLNGGNGTESPSSYGYRFYASAANAGGGDPGDASRWFYGQSGWAGFTLGVDGRKTSGIAVPTVDSGTGGSENYRGFFQYVEEGPALGSDIVGYAKRINAMPSGGQIGFLQDAFGSIFQTIKGDPDWVLFNNENRQTINNLIISDNSAPYRLAYTNGNQANIVAGTLVPSVLNQHSLSGKAVRLETHPWLPKGNAAIGSDASPFPTAFGKTNVMEMIGPADFQQVNWGPTTMRDEFSLYWYNALAIYVPQLCGVIHGIAVQDDPTKGSLR